MQCRISVLMGLYNCASTLREALDSLLVQTYQGFKVIMCDDGSFDNTFEIAKDYTDKYENFILIQNEKNMGLNYTLNHCLEYADTEYCARMDGDDLCAPTRFEKQINFLDEHPEYGIVSSSMLMFDENGEFGARIEDGEPSLTAFLTSTPFCHAPCMVRTKVYMAVGGYSVDKQLLRMEDVDLWLKMYTHGYRGYNLKEKLYSMRDNREAILRRNWLTRRNEMRIRIRVVKELGLPFYNYIYALRPLILYLMPSFIYNYLHKIKNNKIKENKRKLI